MSQWRYRRTFIITVALLAFLGGLGFARTRLNLSADLLLIVSCFCLLTIIKLRRLAIVGITLVAFMLGWWRGQVVLPQLGPVYALNNQHIVATVQAETDAVYDSRSQLTFVASHIHLQDPTDEVLPGQIKIAGFGEPAVYRGDIIRIEGKTFTSRGSNQLSMSFAALKVLGRTSSPIDAVRRNFQAGMQSALPEPLASFAMGLLIGQRSTLPVAVTTVLATVGLTHIIAVSGYNLTIIMRGVRRVLRKRSKYQITVLSIVLIGLFLLTTGLSASIVRAAIVSILGLGAWYYGRSFKPMLLIALAAVITAGWNPLYVWSDIGWYLSFLAFFGVLVVAPLINQRLFGSREPKALSALFIESLCALGMTIPFILYIFHQVSVIALIANLLIVPLVPIAMLLSLVAGLAGMLTPAVAGLLALPARVLLTYMLDVIQLLSRTPHALVQRQLPLGAMLFMYGCVAAMVLTLWHKTLKTAKITEIETTK